MDYTAYVSGGNGEWLCEYPLSDTDEACGDSFSLKRNAVRHVKETHFKVYSASSYKSLSGQQKKHRHQKGQENKRKHLEKGTHICKKCSEPFSNPSHLARHKCNPKIGQLRVYSIELKTITT